MTATVVLTRPRQLAGAIRAFGVMSGAAFLLAVAMFVSVVVAIAAAAAGERPSTLSLIGVGVLAAYVLVVLPWTRHWGATRQEVETALAGDELVAHPGIRMTRAVTIDASPAEVWPWLAQIGQDRGGFYSYAWLENLAGCRLENADRIHPEWQERTVGETVLLHPLNGLRLARFERDRSYVFEGGWGFVLCPLGPDHTRLLARSRVPRGLPTLAYMVFVEAPHFIMERKMLLGIKQRVERRART